jgi:hypothetical protein
MVACNIFLLLPVPPEALCINQMRDIQFQAGSQCLLAGELLHLDLSFIYFGHLPQVECRVELQCACNY